MAEDILERIKQKFTPGKAYTGMQLREIAVLVKATLIRRAGRESIYDALSRRDEPLEQRIPDFMPEGTGLDIYFIEKEGEFRIGFNYEPKAGYFFESSSRNPEPAHWVSRA